MSLEPHHRTDPPPPEPRRPGPLPYLALVAAVVLAALGWSDGAVIAVLAAVAKIAGSW